MQDLSQSQPAHNTASRPDRFPNQCDGKVQHILPLTFVIYKKIPSCRHKSNAGICTHQPQQIIRYSSSPSTSSSGMSNNSSIHPVLYPGFFAHNNLLTKHKNNSLPSRLFLLPDIFLFHFLLLFFSLYVSGCLCNLRLHSPCQPEILVYCPFPFIISSQFVFITHL